MTKGRADKGAGSRLRGTIPFKKNTRRGAVKPRRAAPRKRKRAQEKQDPDKTWRLVREAARLRIGVVAFLLGAGALTVLGRSYQLQVLERDKYLGAADRQALTSSRVVAKRGVVKDRHGAELAITVDVDSIYAEPSKVRSPAQAARSLSKILKTSERTLLRRLKSDRHFVFLARRVGATTSQKVMALRIEGVGTRPEPRRFYSNLELASHVVGFTSFEGKGVAGIERQHDAVLRGRSFEIPGLKDALGNMVSREGIAPQAALEGSDVILTLDRQIQHAAEVHLEAAVRDFEGQAGVAIVLRPTSGEILALASYPDFNPNNLSGTAANEHLNRAISAVYEPGSTMKMVTIAAALEEGVIQKDDELDCEDGTWKVGGRTIRDSNHRYGVLSVSEILKLSSNICSAKIGFALGPEQLHAWLGKFGFGAITGVGLPGELRGLVRPHDQWRPIALANIAFGQGLSVTPLQVARAAATIANGGVSVSPGILREVVDKSGRRAAAPKVDPRRIVSKRTAGMLTQMMSEVTHAGGTAPEAAIPGFEVAGKTGTSQKIDPVTKAYSRTLYGAWFVGFVPAARPEVVVLVMVDEPKKSIYGGVVAAPAFREIAKASLSSLGVFPEDPAAREGFLASYSPATPPVVSDLEGVTLDGRLSTEARRLLGGPQPAEPTAPSAWVDPTEETAALTARGAARMPNFAGLGLLEVLKRSAEAQCDLVLKGTGRVSSQKPRPGVAIQRGARCELELSL